MIAPGARKSSHSQRVFNVVQERQITSLVVHNRIVIRGRAVDVVPHAAAYVLFMKTIRRDRNLVRELHLEPERTVRQQVIALGGGSQRWIDKQRVRILAAGPIRMRASQIDRTESTPKRSQCIRDWSDFSFD